MEFGFVPRKVTRLLRRIAVAIAMLLAHLTGSLVAEEDLGLSVAPGFVVSRFAGDELCHDVFSMTIDSQGRVVVSGPGYVRILVDENQDGVADSAREFVAGPKSGAQGMFFYGPDLICTGDAGLLRYRDRNRDDVADGPPDVFLRARAGTEHDIHAVRKGPDGYWYVVAGNSAEIDERYITLPTSPIKHPHAGTVIRFRPDLTSGEVLADGIRNAYDFDFSLSGDLFIFDSDGERDLSLPWYQPTRVFQVLPGSNVGWVSNSLIRPSDSFDMPPTLASLGRSSPTGVVCYRHTRFPARYHGALFVLDWTFGRIWALPLDEHGGTWKTNPVVFLSAEGENGFAPTDAEVGPDGALYVCIGGRGTRGGVFRIAAKGADATPWTPRGGSEEEKALSAIRAPQPLNSWSRAHWEPLARELGPEPFLAAAVSKGLSGADRIRAIEILTEKFDGLDTHAADLLTRESNPMIRARAAWSIGRHNPQQPDLQALTPYLNDPHPQVARAALEVLIGVEPAVLDQFADVLGDDLAHADPYVRQTAMHVAVRSSPDAYQQISARAINHGWGGALPIAAVYAQRQAGYQPYPVEIASRMLRSTSLSHDIKADAARLMQIGLGDLGSSDGSLPPAFEGYVSRVDLAAYETELDPLRILVAELYPSGHTRLDRELEKLIAMLQPANEKLLEKVLVGITAESSAVQDIQKLIVISRIPVTIAAPVRETIANTIVGLERKIREQELHQDISWDDRVIEVYRALVKQDQDLPLAVLQHPDFGEPGHVQFATEMPPKVFDQVVAVFLKRLRVDPDYIWGNDLVYLLGAADDREARRLVREKFEDYSLRSAVLMSLTENPRQEDRHFYVQGLESSQVDVLMECIKALSLLRGSEEAAENVMLVRTLRRMGSEGDERQARDQVAELLQRNLRITQGYKLAQDSNPQTAAIEAWTQYIRQRFPDEYASQSGESAQDLDRLQATLSQVSWSEGSPERGLQIFTRRACIQCHGGRKALGPDLTGVTGRFSREDLFTAIAFPHRDVSPRYQTTQIATKQGQIHTGLIVYEYPDALVLRDAQNKSYRIATTDIEVRRIMSKSLMPEGLLKDLQPGDLADLYSYLREQSVRTAARDESRTSAQ